MRGRPMLLAFATALVLTALMMDEAAIARSRSNPVTPKLAAAVNIENKRPSPLLSFEIVMHGKDTQSEVVVGKLDKPLPPGGATSFPLVGAHGCAFLARWAFADIKDAGDIDLCNDAHIVLVD